MTINGLSEFLRSLGVPKVGRASTRDTEHTPLRLELLKGKRIAIEIPGIIHKQNWAAIHIVSRQFPFIWLNGHWTMPPDEEVLSMFKVTMRAMIRKIQDTGVIPIFVLEGKSPDAKEGTRKKRNEARDEGLKAVDELQRVQNLIAFQKELPKAYPPDRRYSSVAKELLMEMGMQVYEASFEAEGVCAALVKQGICDMALIDDHDIFMYGCKAVIRNLWSNAGTLEVEGYALRDILIAMGFQDPDVEGEDAKAIERFKLLCILAGSDYASNVHGIGIHTVHKTLLEHGIQTYEEACIVEPRWSTIPYAKIMATIDANASYSLLC